MPDSRNRDRQPGRRRRPVVGLISLGCVKNLVDSEKMLAQIAEAGALITDDEQAADTIVVNTCGFLDAARQEALEVLRELARRKRRGQLRRLVVVGCLVQRDGRRLLEQVPEIDALVGVHNRDDVARAIRPGGGQAVDLYLGDCGPQVWSDRARLRLTPRHYAYVRISEGCDQRCTFCTIPRIRGPLRSKPPAAVVAECQELTADGAQELILIGQDTTSYGADLDDGSELAGLLRRLDAECTGARWIRLMYAYPSGLTDAVIDALAECGRVVKYLDLPLQHINDRMLKAMGRGVTRRQTEALLEKLRRRVPQIAIRTTMLVGFPGEGEREFGELLEFVRGFGFDALGAFRFSCEPGTPAARLSGRVAEAIKADRYERLMLAQQEVAFAAARRRVGQVLEVVVDEAGRDGRGVVGRHAGQAPEVDAVCRIESGPRSGRPPRRPVELGVGRFIEAKVVATRDYDLVVQPMGLRGRGSAGIL